MKIKDKSFLGILTVLMFSLGVLCAPGPALWADDKGVNATYEIDPSVSDSGVTTAQGNRSIKDIMTLVGTSKKVTLVFKNTKSAGTTSFVIGTNLSVTANINLEIKNGALLSPSSGKTLTIDTSKSILALPNQHIFTGAGTVYFTRGSEVYGEWWGAKGDGSTDNLASLQKMLLSGVSNVFHFLPGTYNVPFTSTLGLTIPAGSTVEGDGLDKSIVRFIPSSDTYRALFNLPNDDITFKNLKVETTGFTGQTLVMFNIDASRLIFKDCDFYGGMTNSGVTLSYTAHCFFFAEAGTQDDFLVDSCLLHRFSYVVLKNITATSEQNRMTFSNNRFYNNYNEDLSFNTPKGLMNNIVVLGNNFYSGLGSSASLNQLHVAFAKATNFTVSNNVFEGAVYDAVHIEDGCENGVVNGNAIGVDGIGVLMLDNNISGVTLSPKNIQISNNIISKSGVTKSDDSFGIYLAWDLTGAPSAENTIIQGNVITGFKYGIGIDVNDTDGCSINENVLHSCTYGIWSPIKPSVNAYNNIFKSCDYDSYGALLAKTNNWKSALGLFTTTPASTSGVTMSADLTAYIKPGMSLKYVIGGVTYYGRVHTITASLLTVNGPPLSSTITNLEYDGGTVREIIVIIPGLYEDATSTGLIAADLKSNFIWRLPTSYLVKYWVYSRLHDSGTHGQASVTINGTGVNTTAGGLTIAADATEYLTIVDIDSAAYDINSGEAIEITSVKAGTGDAQDLTVGIIFVTP